MPTNKKQGAKKRGAGKAGRKKPAPKPAAALVQVVAAVVAIDSNFEPVTEAPFKFREKNVYPYLAKKGFKLVRCQGPMARRNDVAPQARKQNVVYLTGVGHGFEDRYTGESMTTIFAVGEYDPAESKNKIVHFFSCETASRLGPDFVAHGCRAFFGYSENFTYPPSLAETFFECDSEIDRAFADGLNAGQVYERTRALFQKQIDRLKATGDGGDLFSASILEVDLSLLRAPTLGPQFGDTEAKLV
jgi:hypothetical protein